MPFNIGALGSFLLVCGIWHIHGIIPKLGYFEGKESTIPYDYGDLFEVIAPRKSLFYCPSMDRNAFYEGVKELLSESSGFWRDSSGNFTVEYPDDVSNFANSEYRAIEKWLEN